MSAISTPNASIIRSLWTGMRDLYVNIPSLRFVASATISATPSSYPAADYSVSGTSANWLDGIESMRYIVRRPSEGNRQISVGILRRNNQVGTARIQARQTGDTGETAFQNEDILSGDTITIYDVRVPKSQFSRIDPVTEALLKRYDTAFDTSGTYTRQTQYLRPHAKLGPHQHIIADPTTGIGRATLTRAGSIFWSFTGTGVWELPTGMTLRAGYTTAMETVEVDVVQGEYQYTNRVEENTSARIQRSYRWLFCTGDTFEAFSDKFAVIGIEDDRHSRLGRTMRLIIRASSTDNVFNYLYTGAPVLVTYKHDFSSNAWQTKTRPTDGTLVENYVGYIRFYQEIGKTPDGMDVYNVLLQSPLEYYGALPIAAQSIIAVDPPTKWSEIASAFASVDAWIYYLVEFHLPQGFQTTDFNRGDWNAFKRYAFGTRGGDTLSALRESARLAGYGGNIGCLSNGEIVLKRHPSYESATYRSSVPTVWTWQPEDVVQEEGAPPITYAREPIMTAGETEGSGSVTSTSAEPTIVTARAGLFASRQGINKQTMEGFIGLSSDDIRDRVGHHEAVTNSPTPSFGFEAAPGCDFVDPALMEWHNTSALATLDPANTGVLSQRQIPLEVTRQWEFAEDGIRKRVFVQFQPETRGARAPIVPTYNPGAPIGMPAANWCYRWDFMVDNGGFSAVPQSGSGTPQGVYVAGVGWTSATTNDANNTRHHGVHISRTASISFLSMEVTYNYTLGQVTTSNNNSAILRITSLGLATAKTFAQMVNGTGLSEYIGGVNGVSFFGVRIDSAERVGASPSPTGSVVITSLTLRGSGTNPFGENNCT